MTTFVGEYVFFREISDVSSYPRSGYRPQGITSKLKIDIIVYASFHSSGRSLCKSSFGVVSIFTLCKTARLSPPQWSPMAVLFLFVNICGKGTEFLWGAQYTSHRILTIYIISFTMRGSYKCTRFRLKVLWEIVIYIFNNHFGIEYQIHGSVVLNFMSSHNIYL